MSAPRDLAQRGGDTLLDAIALLPPGYQIGFLVLIAFSVCSVLLNVFLLRSIAKHAPPLASMLQDVAASIKSLELWVREAMR